MMMVQVLMTRIVKEAKSPEIDVVDVAAVAVAVVG
jgi:hypothetical protein